MDYTYLIIWLVLFLILIVIEMITTALAAVWIGIGCLFGAVLAAFGLPVWLQIIASALVSFLCFAFLRPGIKRKYDRKRWQQSLKNLVGTRALVTSEIDNLRGIGEIRIGGKEYAARSAERGVEIPHGTVVVIVDVRGEIMIVDTDYTVDNNLRSRKSEARLDPGIMDDF